MLTTLLGRGRTLGLGQTLRTAVGGHDRGEVGKLLRLQGEKLVAGLGRLQRTGRALALPDKRGHLATVGVDVADNAGLDPHGVLQAADGVLPAFTRLRDKRLIGSRHRCISVGGLERAIEPQITTIYRRFGLNDRQIEILARAMPKRDYYCQSRRGNRLFELGLSDVALALCAASSKQHQALIAEVHARSGTDGFLSEWLISSRLAWAADLIPNLTNVIPQAHQEVFS